MIVFLFNFSTIVEKLSIVSSVNFHIKQLFHEESVSENLIRWKKTFQKPSIFIGTDNHYDDGDPPKNASQNKQGTRD